MKKRTIKQCRLSYAFFKLLANIVAKFKFKRKFLRNELRGKKGPMVVISNHAAALDFVNLIGATRRPMHFVISSSFYRTLPFKGIVRRLGLIPKQQFQTTLGDMRSMKHVIDDGKILVIYPTGLMSDDGGAQPLPVATYQFLKWLKADVYMAKNIGTYFSMPKWREDGMRGGRTFIDIYKLFDADELDHTDLSLIQAKLDKALSFDAYEEQEELLIKYKRNRNIKGLENILYQCPHCGKEYTVQVKNKSTIYCEECGFAETADAYQFLHKASAFGEEIRHPSKWSNLIRENIKKQIEQGELSTLTTPVKIQTIPEGKCRFENVGKGTLTLCAEHFNITGLLGGTPTELTVPILQFASLPYKPGSYIELQHGADIYRCWPENGRIVTKLIHMVELFYELQTATAVSAEIAGQ